MTAPSSPGTPPEPETGPRLSVVVTIVEGGRVLERFLTALRDQVDPPSLEVLVPYDDSVEGIAAIRTAFPDFDFLPMGSVSTDKPIGSPAGQHELFDRRRAAGLATAGGEIVAILEDRGVPTPDWAHRVDAAHALPHEVIGGVVDCGVDRLRNWAVFFCDFSRYQPPVGAGPRDYVTDVNISYKRAALERTRSLWEERYHETTVHWALVREGATLFLTPDVVVHQHREKLGIGEMLAERLDWGRLFAYTRAREASVGKRALFAVAAPLLPGLLFLRHARTQASKGRLGTFLRASPLVAALLVAWSAGEWVGYVTGRP